MKINKHTYPFTFYEIEEFLTKDENDLLYKKLLDKKEIVDITLKKAEPNSIGIDLIDDFGNDIISDILNPKFELSDIKKITEDTIGGTWGMGGQYHFDHILKPHTDNPYELIQWASEGIIPDREEYGFYKGLVYIGDRSIEYTDYGTRIYESEDIKSEFKEVKFIPGNCIIFKCDEKSFHGTDFKSEFKYDRFTIGLEYVKKIQ